MKRFIKISISILIVFTVFFIGNKLIFKDIVHVNDYEENNRKEISVDLYDKKVVNEGIIFKFKIKNESKYTYRLDSAKLTFPSKINQENEEVLYWAANLELTQYKRDIEGNENFVSESDKMLLYGIKPYEEGYTVDLPFLETEYIGLQEDNRSHSFNFEAHNID